MSLSPEAIKLGESLHAHLLDATRRDPDSVTVSTALDFLEQHAPTTYEQGRGLTAAIAIEHRLYSEQVEDLLQLLYDTDNILKNRQDAEFDALKGRNA